MSAERPDDPPPTPAEQRLNELLGLLQARPPASPPALTGRVVNAARWERGLRTSGATLGSFGTSVVHGLVMLLGLQKRQR
jgi:hypothetical protein